MQSPNKPIYSEHFLLIQNNKSFSECKGGHVNQFLFLLDFSEDDPEYFVPSICTMEKKAR